MSIRFGILGAARIAPEALVRPARRNGQVSVEAVASRTRSHAEAFAREHRIPTVHDDMDALLADPDLDAVYIALPNGLHAEWAERALRAGKHVLVEKPVASNADEAAKLEQVAAESSRVCMVGYHYRYHPLMAALREMLPRIGHLQEVETQFHVGLDDRDDIRYDYALAGGALMDLGCYEIHLLRYLTDLEPEVVSATARPADDERIDERMDAELRLLSIRATISSSLREEESVQRAVFKGSDGEIVVEGFVLPQLGNRIHVVAPDLRHDHSVSTSVTSYDGQLQQFVSAVEHDRPFPTTVADSVATMRVIDDVYRAAGLPLR